MGLAVGRADGAGVGATVGTVGAAEFVGLHVPPTFVGDRVGKVGEGVGATVQHLPQRRRQFSTKWGFTVSLQF